MDSYKQLGFTATYFPPGFAILRRDAIEIFLQQQPGYIVTDNVKALYAEYAALPAVTISRPLCVQEYGIEEFDSIDRNEHRLVFAQPVADA
jgi:hypothetical protein